MKCYMQRYMNCDTNGEGGSGVTRTETRTGTGVHSTTRESQYTDIKGQIPRLAVPDSPGRDEFFTSQVMTGSLGADRRSGHARAKLISASGDRRTIGNRERPKGGSKWKSDCSARW
jgi:hypothetical protein